MSKGKAKSIRFEERLEKLIEGQEGKSFTDKLESVLTNHFSEDREKYLQRLEEQIEEKLEGLRRVAKTANEIQRRFDDVDELVIDVYRDLR